MKAMKHSRTRSTPRKASQHRARRLHPNGAGLDAPHVDHLTWKGRADTALDELISREWMVTNGLGGYAAGTVVGMPTRRFHALLVAALPGPIGRATMLSQVAERVIMPNAKNGARDKNRPEPGKLNALALSKLTGFRLEDGLPVWRYESEGYVLEKRIVMPHEQNTVYVHYELLAGRAPVTLEVEPALQFRRHEDRLDSTIAQDYPLTRLGDRYELIAPEPYPPLKLRFIGDGSMFESAPRPIENLQFGIESSRGYDATGKLWSPGRFRATLSVEHPVTLVASTESWDTIEALSPQAAFGAEAVRRLRLVRAAHPAAREGLGRQLVFAADQFIFTPVGRVADAARVHAAGDQLRSVIAGYHWFTDWGRDTMISLEGLTLTTGRHEAARDILRTFAYYLRDGLIPNLLPEGANEGLYHTADATLWFFHAISRYLDMTGDEPSLRRLLPVMRGIVDHHLRGTHFNIGVDPADGLVRQGKDGYQLTWMDAKVGDWVVTPRRGKTVEINALWYNALRLLEGWVRKLEGEGAAAQYAELADRVQASFNARFWIPRAGYLFDLIDGERGDDAAMRPNQLLAVSLPHAVLDPSRWKSVLDQVLTHLATPVGLRSLAPGHPDYKPRYDGDLRSRDAAYHQGTVWAWLAGPLVDAWLKVHPKDYAGARKLLSGFSTAINAACVGTVAEIFDADPPFTPRGCVAQAWSVAEVLRAWVKTAQPSAHSAHALKAPARAAPAAAPRKRAHGR